MRLRHTCYSADAVIALSADAFVRAEDGVANDFTLTCLGAKGFFAGFFTADLPTTFLAGFPFPTALLAFTALDGAAE